MVKLACEGIDGCNPLELELDSRIQFRDGMSTKEIQKILIQTAIEKVIQSGKDNQGNNIRKTNANWQYVAARLLCFDLYKEAKISRNYNNFGYGDYYELVKKLVEAKLYGEYLIENYSDEEIKELGNYIVPERDELFNYEGLKLLNDRYLIKGHNGEILELPQERFMTIAMHLAIPEGNNRVFLRKNSMMF